MDTAYKGMAFTINKWDWVRLIWTGLALMIVYNSGYRRMDTTDNHMTFSIRNQDTMRLI